MEGQWRPGLGSVAVAAAVESAVVDSLRPAQLGCASTALRSLVRTLDIRSRAYLPDSWFLPVLRVV